MLHDLGVAKEDFGDEKRLSDLIHFLEKRFDIGNYLFLLIRLRKYDFSIAEAKQQKDCFSVLIKEYFDESIVLLKHLMCWQYEDVAFFKLNSREESKKSSLSLGARERLRNSMKSDYTLYNHFR